MHPISDEETQQEKTKQAKQPKEDKGKKGKSNQKGTTKAQRRAAARFNNKKKQSEMTRKRGLYCRKSLRTAQAPASKHAERTRIKCRQVRQEVVAGRIREEQSKKRRMQKGNGCLSAGVVV